MRRFKIAGDLIAVVIPVLQALPKILDLLFLILLCAERIGVERPGHARSLGRCALMPGRSNGLLGRSKHIVQ
jgi:hypothetical protein